MMMSKCVPGYARACVCLVSLLQSVLRAGEHLMGFSDGVWAHAFQGMRMLYPPLTGIKEGVGIQG
jgi:hypothetical protein